MRNDLGNDAVRSRTRPARRRTGAARCIDIGRRWCLGTGHRWRLGAVALPLLTMIAAAVPASCGGEARGTPSGGSTSSGIGSSGIGSSGSSSSGSSSGSGGGGGGGGGGAPVSCDPLPATSNLYTYNCSQPMGCGEGYACGGLDAVFDEQGCLRPSCYDDADCPGTDRCYRAVDFGGCAPSTLSCADAIGGCECVGPTDCGGSYCVPDTLYPG